MRHKLLKNLETRGKSETRFTNRADRRLYTATHDLSRNDDKQDQPQAKEQDRSMDTSRTSSYVALKLREIQQRFEELQEDDLSELRLEDADFVSADVLEGYDPYGRS